MSYSFIITADRNSAFAKFLRSKNLSFTDKFLNFVFESKEYDTLEECERDFSRNMQKLCIFEESNADIKYTLVGKSNDEYTQGAYDKQQSQDIWDRSMLYKFYVAEIESLKRSILKYKVFGHVKVANSE